MVRERSMTIQMQSLRNPISWGQVEPGMCKPEPGGPSSSGGPRTSPPAHPRQGSYHLDKVQFHCNEKGGLQGWPLVIQQIPAPEPIPSSDMLWSPEEEAPAAGCQWEAVVMEAGMHIHPDAQLSPRPPRGRSDLLCSSASLLQKPDPNGPPPGSLHSISPKPGRAPAQSQGETDTCLSDPEPHLWPSSSQGYGSSGSAGTLPKTNG